MYKSPRCFLPSFESVGLSVQEKKRKTDFQDGHHDGHLRFPIETILAIFDPQITLMISYQVSSHLAFRFRRRREKIDFQDGHHDGHLGFPIEIILAFFDVQVTPMLPTKFLRSYPFGSGEKAKNRFLCWSPLRPSWIFDRNDFRYFWSTGHSNASYQVSSQLAFRFRFSRWRQWRPSWISDRTDFSYF